MNPHKDAALEEIDALEAAPAVTAPVVTEAEKAAQWQAQADAAIEDALLRPHKSILSVKLQPFTSARGSLLRRAKNEFISGVKFVDIEDPFLAIGKFLLLMSVTLDEGRKLVADADKLDDEAYKLLDNLPISSIEQVVVEINRHVEQEMSTQVHGELTDDMKKVAESSPKN